MSSPERTSNDRLCEFLDRELSREEEKEFLATVRSNPALRQRLHEYRRVRELVRAAFEADDKPERPRVGPWRGSMAAGILLALGFAVGWATHVHRTTEIAATNLAAGDPASFYRLAQHINSHPDSLHALLHVNSRDPAAMAAVLDDAETLLRSYRAEHKQLQLEVLANSGGLDLLRSDVSQFRRRIAQLQKKYPNVSFLACGRTLQRLATEQKLRPRLLPGVRVVPSALDQILLRLNEGWVYVKA